MKHTGGIYMMKKILSITMVVALALTALLSCAAPALAASSYKVRATASVNLRTGPGLGYAKVTSVKSGTTLSYTGVSRFDSRGAGLAPRDVQRKHGVDFVAVFEPDGRRRGDFGDVRGAGEGVPERAQGRGHELWQDHHRFQRHEHGLPGRNCDRERDEVVQGIDLGGHRLGVGGVLVAGEPCPTSSRSRRPRPRLRARERGC